MLDSWVTKQRTAAAVQIHHTHQKFITCYQKLVLMAYTDNETSHSSQKVCVNIAHKQTKL